MSTITASNADYAAADNSRAGSSMLRRIYAALIASRTRNAQRRIAVYLEGMSDEQLAGYGWSEAHIASIRAAVPSSSTRASSDRTRSLFATVRSDKDALHV